MQGLLDQGQVSYLETLENEDDPDFIENVFSMFLRDSSRYIASIEKALWVEYCACFCSFLFFLYFQYYWQPQMIILFVVLICLGRQPQLIVSSWKEWCIDLRVAVLGRGKCIWQWITKILSSYMVFHDHNKFLVALARQKSMMRTINSENFSMKGIWKGKIYISL